MRGIREHYHFWEIVNAINRNQEIDPYFDLAYVRTHPAYLKGSFLSQLVQSPYAKGTAVVCIEELFFTNGIDMHTRQISPEGDQGKEAQEVIEAYMPVLNYVQAATGGSMVNGQPQEVVYPRNFIREPGGWRNKLSMLGFSSNPIYPLGWARTSEGRKRIEEVRVEHRKVFDATQNKAAEIRDREVAKIQESIRALEQKIRELDDELKAAEEIEKERSTATSTDQKKVEQERRYLEITRDLGRLQENIKQVEANLANAGLLTRRGLSRKLQDLRGQEGDLARTVTEVEEVLMGLKQTLDRIEKYERSGRKPHQIQSDLGQARHQLERLAEQLYRL